MYSMLRVYYSACKYIGLYKNGSGLLFHYLSIEKRVDPKNIITLFIETKILQSNVWIYS